MEKKEEIYNKINSLCYKHFRNIDSFKTDNLAKKPFPVEPEEKKIALCRNIIGYNIAFKMSEDEDIFINIISKMIKNMVEQAENNLGSLEDRDITLYRQVGDYFRDIEESSCFEFRLLITENAKKS